MYLGENTSDQFVDLNKVMIFYGVTLAEVAVNKYICLWYIWSHLWRFINVLYVICAIYQVHRLGPFKPLSPFAHTGIPVLYPTEYIELAMCEYMLRGLSCRHFRTVPTQSSSSQQKEKMILWWKILQGMCSQIQSPSLHR